MAISLLPYAATFTEVLFLEKLLIRFFSRVTTSTQQLLSRSSYFFRAPAFFEELLFHKVASFEAVIFFQNSYFSREKLLPSSHFLRTESSLGQLLFGTTTFLTEELFRIKISTEELLFPSR